MQGNVYHEGKVSDYAPPCLYAGLQARLEKPGHPGRAQVKRELYAALDAEWIATCESLQVNQAQEAERIRVGREAMLAELAKTRPPG